MMTPRCAGLLLPGGPDAPLTSPSAQSPRSWWSCHLNCSRTRLPVHRVCRRRSPTLSRCGPSAHLHTNKQTNKPHHHYHHHHENRATPEQVWSGGTLGLWVPSAAAEDALTSSRNTELFAPKPSTPRRLTSLQREQYQLGEAGRSRSCIANVLEANRVRAQSATPGSD